MLTSKDISNLIQAMTQIFATKEELSEVKLEFKEDMRKITTLIDGVMKELKDMRQEQTFHIQKHRDIDGRLDYLEKRVDILEQPSF